MSFFFNAVSMTLMSFALTCLFGSAFFSEFMVWWAWQILSDLTFCLRILSIALPKTTATVTFTLNILHTYHSYFFLWFVLHFLIISLLLPSVSIAQLVLTEWLWSSHSHIPCLMLCCHLLTNLAVVVLRQDIQEHIKNSGRFYKFKSQFCIFFFIYKSYLKILIFIPSIY